jgi:hypothetical protein
MTKTTEHVDILGNILNDGDIIAYSHHNNLKIGTIKKSSPKMIIVMPIGKKYLDRKYPNETVKLDSSRVSLYILKNNN